MKCVHVEIVSSVLMVSVFEVASYAVGAGVLRGAPWCWQGGADMAS